jgi:hypothetical protein
MAASALPFPRVCANDNPTETPPSAPAALARQRRLQIEGEIEMHLQRVDILIARLDLADCDCDLEEDDPAEEDDHSGDPLDDGEAPTDNGQELLPLKPIYGVDQSLGPINGREAYRAWREELCRESA